MFLKVKNITYYKY